MPRHPAIRQAVPPGAAARSPYELRSFRIVDGQVTEEPWAASAPDAGGDVWNTPGNYTDETPF